MAVKRNTKSDIRRMINQEIISIEKREQTQESLRSMKDFPDDIKQGILDLHKKGIDSQKRMLEILKMKL